MLNQNRCEIKWGANPPAFDKYKSFGLDDLTAKYSYFRCSRPSDVDGVKIFDEDDKSTKNIKIKNSDLWPVHIYQKF